MTEERKQIYIPEEEGEERMIPVTPQVNEAETEIEDLSDLFRGIGEPDTEDVTTVSEEDVFGKGGSDMRDLFQVPDTSARPTPPKKHKPIKRTSKPYPPPTTLGGIR